MIQVSNLEKSFDDFHALNDLSLNVKRGSIYGLVGSNGSGKTTVIKHIMGVFKPDAGTITVEGEPVYENSKLKSRMGYVPDDLSFYAAYNLKDLSRFFKSFYPGWDQQRFTEMCDLFSLSADKKLSRFSKGMQKQAVFILTMSSKPDYLILDEPIDGLDPLVRKLVWKYIVEDVAEREMSVLVSSHNLREMEGICDSIGILSKGEMHIERDLDELKSDIHKVQVAFAPGSKPDAAYQGLNVLHRESRGSVDLLVIRNPRNLVEAIIGESRPVLFDMLPLTLEEVFIYELGGENNEIESILP